MWVHHNHNTLRTRYLRYVQYLIKGIRALSLRNLVLGYECGRVFPASVGPEDSLSRDAANWLSSRFSQSVETRRWYGWLRMVFPGARLFRAPIWWPSGGINGGMRKARSAVVESLVALYRVVRHQIRRGRREARSSTNQGSAEPLCVRIKGTNREVSEGKADLLTMGCFLPTRANKERRTGKIRGAFFRNA